MDDLPKNYSVDAMATDDYSITYTMENVSGQVMTYNEIGTAKGLGTVTMVVAYQMEGELITEEEDGPPAYCFC